MDWKYEDGRVYSLDEKGEVIAEATFKRAAGDRIVDIDHTYVTPSLRGRGVAADMMAVVARHLREKGLKAVASCSYANVWLKRNKGSYQDIISEDIENQVHACSINGRH